MFCKRLDSTFAFVGVASFALSLFAVFIWDNRHHQEHQIETSFEELEITGFEQVTSAKDGDILTVIGTVDGKGICNSYQLGKSGDLCEAWLIDSGREFQGMPIRIRMCSETVNANCMLPFKVQEYAYVLDAHGKTIDFQGYKQIGPNAWTHEGGCMLRITGRVTRVNGVGRIVDPVAQIEAGPRY